MVPDLPLGSLSDEALVEEMISDFKIKSTMLPTNLKKRNPMIISDLEKLTQKIGQLRKTKPGDFAADSDFTREITSQANNFKIQRCDEFFDLQICQYVVEMVNLQSKHKGEFNPFSILIHGHPSSGKTTSLLTIADTLSKLIEQKSILPLYSELQISDTHNVIDDNLIWSRVISGVREYNIRTSKLAKSFDEYVKFTQENNKIPLIVIDTVDVLLTNLENKEKFVEGWIKFLEKAHNSGVNIIFTSRTQEWNTAIEPLQTPITDISLPELLLYQIEPYHFALGEKKYPEKFEQFTRVIQALMPLIVDKRDKNYYKESSEELRKYLQQNSFDPSSLNRRELEHRAIKIHKNNNLQSSFSKEFIEKLYDWFENKLDSPIIKYTDTIALVNDSPIKLFFDYCWNEWKSNNKKRFTDEQIHEFMRCFCEAIFKISKGEINSLTKKIFFEIDRVISIVKLNNTVNISRDNISKMMNSLTKTDLLNYRAGKFSFAHQLLHTLTISNTEDNKKDEYLDELTNYIPSDSRDFIRLIGGVYTWKKPSENKDDCKTIDNHKNMIQLFYPRALYPKAEEQDEEQEDKLLKYLPRKRVFNY